MALTFTEKFRYSAGGRNFLYLDVGQDETTSTFTAASVGLTYLDFVGQLGFKAMTSAAANQSVFIAYTTTSVYTEGLVALQGTPMKVGSTKHLLLIGW